MELKLDVKTLVIGIALGIIVTAVIGAGKCGQSRFRYCHTFGYR